VQEGLTNVVRHASASEVELFITHTAGHLTISLADNGRGCDGQVSPQAGSGLGLAGMAERIALLGGQLKINNRQGEGFCLVVSLPDHLPHAYLKGQQ
jgi:two-component system sensor histidine kinase UhpB